ncbi:MAG: aminoacyl--tRNA ligase-related protein, partial [Acidimicrobiales bacterium]
LLALAARWAPTELRFPPLMAAADLAPVDYLGSFPHLATFATCLDGADAGMGASVAADGTVEHSATEPVRHLLTPAACYHLYVHHRGQRLPSARHFTVRATCFRREEHFVPLERQWSFAMREVVCMGTAGEVRRFLAEAREEVDRLAGEAGLPVTWAQATDPFFQPAHQPKWIMQRLDPVKHELVFDGRLAIASVN